MLTAFQNRDTPSKTCHVLELSHLHIFEALCNNFVIETATFIIHDDLRVIPNDLVKSLSLLQMNGINDIVDIERKMLLMSKKEACFL